MKTPTKKKRYLLVLIHIIGWAFVLLMPFFVEFSNEGLSWKEYLHRLSFLLYFLAIFYINYVYLIDKYLFKRKVRQYIAINLLLVAIGSISIHLTREKGRVRNKIENVSEVNRREERKEEKKDSIFVKSEKRSGPDKEIGRFAPPPPMDMFPPSKKGGERPDKIIFVFIFRSIFSLVLIVGLAVAIKITGRWYEDEAARNKLEKSKTEAELKNLKNQINPHFLLNTLNNIYALIAFDSDKAQQAVQDLSKLLRYVLYENQEKFVPLTREVEFIRNYIELMKIRLTNHISVTTTFNITKNSTTCIAPLIFISLIENAFKHGVSPTANSFIDIMLEETNEGKIICRITNSYHPKTETDKSGSGIGLEQVSKRLELLYKGRYIWHKGVSETGTEYCSLLIINPLENDGATDENQEVV